MIGVLSGTFNIHNSMILGIACGAHNSSACILHEGEVEMALEEERISRYKRDGRFPNGAVNTILNEYDPIKISKIAVSGTEGAPIPRRIKHRIQHPGSQNRLFTIPYSIYNGKKNPNEFMRSLAAELKNETPLDRCNDVINKMEYVDHHLSHASSAYFTSGLDEATVLTFDSAGDLRSSSIYHAVNGNLEHIFSSDSVNSLGRLWSRLPTVFGFKGARHAGKFMGLAAYVDEIEDELQEQFKTMIEVTGLEIINHWATETYGKNHEQLVVDLKDRFGEYPAPMVAKALQERTEEVITKIVENAVDHTGCGNIALAGGIMANVKINQRIYELPVVDKIWVHQAMSDSGLSVGSAYYIGNKEYGWESKQLSSVDLGPKYDSSEIDDSITKYDGEISNFNVIKEDKDKLAEEAANHLANDDVVCLYDGRMEFGPRALGQRSILCSPTDEDSIRWLNDRLDRTEFMPFAPVTLQSEAEECYPEYCPERCPSAHHMTIALDCSQEMKQRSPGVVHIDGTARPQILNRTDSIYYKILESYHNKTGIPSLINTSFNMHGEPLVCTPQQAIESWLQNNSEVLILQDRLIQRSEN